MGEIYMIKVYTQENCPNCEELKAFLKEKRVSFEELDVNADTKARAVMVMNDLETTPAVSVDGKVFGGDLNEIKSKVETFI